MLDQTAHLPFTVLLILLAARTLVDAPGSATRFALLQPLTQRAAMRPETANATFSAAERVALIAGPPCAALLATLTSPVAALYVDAATFFLSAALIGVLVRSVSPSPQGTGLVSDVKANLATIAHTPALRVIIAVVVVTNLIDAAFTPVVLLVFSRDILGSARWVGLLVAVLGVGTVLGTFLYGPLSRRVLHNRFATFVGAIACIALMRAVLAFEPGIAGAALVLFALGLAAGPLNPLIATVLQVSTPQGQQGRVFGVVLALAFIAAPFGILVQAWLINLISLGTTLWVFAGLYGLTAVGAWLSRGLRAMPRPEPTA